MSLYTIIIFIMVRIGISELHRAFIHRAGFELGTGLSVNVVDPAQAARVLKTV